MKKLKVLITALFILALIFGYWYKNVYTGKSYKSTQFLFDTTCSITAYGANAKEAAEEAFGKIEEIHRLTDFYSESSEVSKINSAASNEEIKINQVTANIISTALLIGEKSEGAFDITIAPVTVLWDFKSGDNLVPEKSKVREELKKVDYRFLELDKEKSVIIKKNDDVKIDLGGAAKGYACDAAIEILEKYGCSAIVDLGGNISCTGKNPASKDGVWRVGLQIPFKPTGEYEKRLDITSGSVVTSGTYQRYFEKGDSLYHHIIDPKDGFPKGTKYNAVTVKADSSLLADCLSTACFVLGEEKGKALAEEFGAEIYYY